MNATVKTIKSKQDAQEVAERIFARISGGYCLDLEEGTIVIFKARDYSDPMTVQINGIRQPGCFYPSELAEVIIWPRRKFFNTLIAKL